MSLIQCVRLLKNSFSVNRLSKISTECVVFLKIYNLHRKSDREAAGAERIFCPLVHSPNNPQQPCGKAKARHLEPHPALLLGPCSAPFQGAAGRYLDWKQSSSDLKPGTPIWDAVIASWSLNRLCHSCWLLELFLC